MKSTRVLDKFGRVLVRKHEVYNYRHDFKEMIGHDVIRNMGIGKVGLEFRRL